MSTTNAAPRMSAFTLGRCPAKGCRHSTRSESAAMAGDCPAHGRYALSYVWGYVVPAVKCGARCRSATGPSCDCACGTARTRRSTRLRSEDEAFAIVADQVLDGWAPLGVFDLDTGELIEVHVAAPVVTRSEDQGITANPLEDDGEAS